MLDKIIRGLIGSSDTSSQPQRVQQLHPTPINNMGVDNHPQEFMIPQEFFVPDYLNPYVNPNADWEVYRQLVAQQQFLQNQRQQIIQNLQEVQMSNELSNFIQQRRSEMQQQNIANGVSSEYYARLNAAYEQGKKNGGFSI